MLSTKILVVEDHEPFRRYVCSALQQRVGLEVLEASDGLDAVWKADEFRPDLIILDIGLPKLSGIAAAEQIHKLMPHAKLLFLTQETDVDVIREAFCVGGRGYVHKGRAESDLLPAIDAVLRGQMFLSSGLEFDGNDHAPSDFYRRLDEINTSAARMDVFTDLLNEILDAGMKITAADLGNIQFCNHEGTGLKLVVQHGFGSEFVQYFEDFSYGEHCICGTALRNRKQIVVEDVSIDPIFGDAEARAVLLNANARSCQSTPLSTRDGDVIGILNTHHRRAYRPPDSTVQLLNRFAQQAAELIKRSSMQT